MQEFFRREDSSRQRAQKLEVQIVHLSHNLHQAGVANQNGRLVVNNLQANLNQLQTAYAASEAARMKSENGLQEERLEHRGTRESLTHEINTHADTEKSLSCCWQTLKKLGDFCNYISNLLDGKPEDRDMEKQINFADLMLEVEFRKQTIDDLKKEVRVREEKRDFDVAALEQKLKNEAGEHEDTLKEKDYRIAELECMLFEQQVKEEPDLNHPSMPPLNNKRKRRTRRSNGITNER